MMIEEDNDVVTIVLQPDLELEEKNSQNLVQDVKAKHDKRNEMFLITMAGLTLTFCILEGFVAMLCSSLAMLSDAFHNLSDVCAIFLALYVQKMKKRGVRNPDYPFGYKRLEVLGGFVNAVCISTLCLYILLSAVPKFFNPEDLEATWVFIGIGMTGVCLNLLGVVFFHSANIPHAHAHGSCSHKHAQSSVHTLQTNNPEEGHEVDVEIECPSIQQQQHQGEEGSQRVMEVDASHCHKLGHDHDHSHRHQHGHSHSCDHNTSKEREDSADRGSFPLKNLRQRSNYHKLDEPVGNGHSGGNAIEKSHSHHHGHSHGHHHSNGDSNIWAVFIHSLTDALSSAMVVCVGLIVHYYGKKGERDWLDYLDTVLSMVMALVTVMAMWPLLKHSAHILMEGTPAHVNRELVEKSILKVHGVISVDNLHIIQLNSNECFAAVQVSCDASFRNQVLVTVKQVFEMHGIQRSTVEIYY